MVPDEVLSRIDELIARCGPGPWTASVEERDHHSGDSFIQTGPEHARGEDIYVTRDSGPASSDYLDLIALLRTHAPDLTTEVRRSREP